MSSTPLVFSTAYSGRVRCGTARRPRPAAAVPRNAPHTARAAPPPRAERIAGAHRVMGTGHEHDQREPDVGQELKGSGPPRPDSPTRWDPAPFRRTAPPAPPGDRAAPAAPAGDAGSLANALTAGVAKSIRRLPARGPRPPPPTCIGAPTGSAPHLAAGAVVVDDLVPSQTRPEPGTARQRGSRQHPDQPVAANRRCPAESFRAPPPHHRRRRPPSVPCQGVIDRRAPTAPRTPAPARNPLR